MGFDEARRKYSALGVDADRAIEKLKTVPVSLHCWQGDDVREIGRASCRERV